MTNAGKSSEMDMKACIDACSACHSECFETVQYCLDKGGKHSAAAHIALMLNCAEISALAVSFMAGKSVFQAELCGLCAEICEKCAEECDSFDDERMKECAAICRKCVGLCKTYVKHGCC